MGEEVLVLDSSIGLRDQIQMWDHVAVQLLDVEQVAVDDMLDLISVKDS